MRLGQVGEVGMGWDRSCEVGIGCVMLGEVSRVCERIYEVE